MIEEELWELLEVINIALGAAVLVLALMIMRMTPKVDMNLLQAMIFLKKGFLKRTWILFFLSVLFFVVREWVIAIPELTGGNGIIPELAVGEYEDVGAGAEGIPEERYGEEAWEHEESGENLLYAILEVAYILCLLLITHLWYGLVKECYRDRKK